MSEAEVCSSSSSLEVSLLCLWLPSDGNCIHMVDTGIVQKLLELLDRHVEEGNVTVQHAALSALRNLAIPGEPPHSWNVLHLCL